MTTLYVSPDIGKVSDKLSKKGVLVLVENEQGVTNKNILTIAEAETQMLEQNYRNRPIDIEIIDWIKSFADRSIFGDNSIKQLTEYEGTSLWWFAETMLFRENIANGVSLRDIVRRTETLKFIIGKYAPSKVIIHGNELISKCAMAVCMSLKVRHINVDAPAIADNSQDMRRPILLRCAKKARLDARTILCRINKEKYEKQRSSIMIMSYYSCLKDADKGGKKDFIFSSTIDQIRQNTGEVPRMAYVDRRMPLGLSSIRYLEAPRFPAELHNRLFSRKMWKFERKMDFLWKRLTHSKKFRKKLNYNSIDLWPLLKDHFAFIFTKQFSEAARQIDAMMSMLEAEGPKIIIIHNETGFYGRAIIAASKKMNIKTIGIQHGTLSSTNLEYIHKGVPGDLSCPVPDVTAVWGRKAKEFLLKSPPYDETNVVITGNPRYDSLVSVSEIYDKDRFRERHGISHERIIAVTTQPFPIYSERVKWLDALVSQVRGIDAAVIIKPHPGESEHMHKSICEKYGSSNLKVIKDADTLELLYISDLAITSYSSTGHESLLLGTPLITFNLTGKKDTVGYADSGAAININEKTRLAPAIMDILENKIPPDLESNMKRYVEDYAFRIDGKASDRIARLAFRMLEDST